MSLQGNCNENTASDLGVAGLSLRAALQGAWMNVEINLSSLKDQTFVDSCRQKGRALLDKALKKTGQE